MKPFTFEQLRAALALRSVSRASLHYMHKAQKVDQHCYRAAALYEYLGGTELRAMLFHDAEETATGDIPSPAKQLLSGLSVFDYLRPAFKSKKQKELGKMCDLLETVLDLLEHKEAYGKLPTKMAIILMVESIRVLEKAIKLRKLKAVNGLLVKLGYKELGVKRKVVSNE